MVDILLLKLSFLLRNSLLRLVPSNTEIFFVQFVTMREKQILARAIEIQKENWG